MSDSKTHNEMVEEFLRNAEANDPDKYKEVCAKYPTLSRSKLRALRWREVNVGLLGLQPSRISQDVAAQHDLDYDFGEDND